MAKAICPNANAMPSEAAPNSSASPTPTANEPSATAICAGSLTRRRLAAWRFVSSGLALQQLQHRLRRLVRLSEHRRAGLLQDLQLREVDHLRCHVHVADAALRGGQVLLVDGQVRQRVLEAVLHGAELGTLRADRV